MYEVRSAERLQWTHGQTPGPGTREMARILGGKGHTVHCSALTGYLPVVVVENKVTKRTDGLNKKYVLALNQKYYPLDVSVFWHC